MNRKKDRFWYEKPAEKWIEALPLGNGRMGAMVYGGTLQEIIQVDEASFWSGEPSGENNRPESKALLGELRSLLLEEKYEEADRKGRAFTGNKNNYGTNMPVANLTMTLEHPECRPEAYERSLCLEDGIAVTGFRMDGITFEREVFVSNPAQAAVVCMRASAPCSLCIRYDGIGNNTRIMGETGQSEKGGRSCYRIAGDARESLHSDGSCGVHLEGCMEVECDGSSRYEEHGVYVSGCTRVVLYLDLETTMFLKEPEKLAEKRVQEAGKKGWEALRAEHIADVAPMYQRMTLSLGGECDDTVPTDLRIANVAGGNPDNGLMELMFQYGRYLLIASSREDSILPTHMGGIWNDNIYNNIDCTQDMHIDMNLQMQYWAAAQCALAECYRPYFTYVESILMPSGRKTAKEVYGAGGWTAHVVSNPWGFTSLGWAYNWGVWSLGGVWCAILAWDYYTYTGNRRWFREHGYPILEEAARFVVDYVFMDEKSGFYMAGPSYSPENMFRTDGKDYFLALSNTCDVILIRELLSILRQAAGILKTGDDVLLNRAAEISSKLPPYKIGRKGQLQEWYYDFEEPKPNHRHTSHLLGLYPYWQIIPEEQPSLAEAARRSIELRYQDFEITSWGMNMLMGYYARLSDGAHACDILQDIMRRLVKPNMASVMSDEASMWCGTWELDGNTGLTSAMAEMFVQSRDGVLKILPALPVQWSRGQLTGICVKGGHRVDISWEDGACKRLTVYPGSRERILLQTGGTSRWLDLKEGETMVLGENLEATFMS